MVFLSYLASAAMDSVWAGAIYQMQAFGISAFMRDCRIMTLPGQEDPCDDAAEAVQEML